MTVRSILTHPGSAHKDDFLACCVLLALYPVPIRRREPTPDELEAPDVCVIDTGGRHEPETRNFDHHQFERDHPPVCSLSLVLQAEGLYEDARLFCDWLETAEWLDARGPEHTARRLGVEREVLARLLSPIDLTLLRRFSRAAEVIPGETLWEAMRWIGEDLVHYLTSMRERLDGLRQRVVYWSVPVPAADASDGALEAVFLERTNDDDPDPSQGLERFLVQEGKAEQIIALVYPDRRGPGYGLARHRDHPRLDFSRLEGEPDVTFAHKQGFVAKTTATDPGRLRELLVRAHRTS
jgi:hypothetical protein